MLIDSNGNKWYKGNLHTHTSVSDGKLAPHETIELYRSNGYDFIALTDHWTVSESKKADGILSISGCEYHTGTTPAEGVFHIVGIGMKSIPKLSNKPELPPVQNIIDEINAAEGLAILAHPAWSLETPEQIMPLKGLAATEIYNTVSGIPWNIRPYSGHIVDLLAVNGKFLRCVADDDTHFYNGDACRSYVMVKADELTEDSIIKAIRSGDFYATQGPDFSVSVSDGVVNVKTSPVDEIIFYTSDLYAGNRVIQGDGICEGMYTCPKGTMYVRVELKDKLGRSAWSSPIKLR